MITKRTSISIPLITLFVLFLTSRLFLAFGYKAPGSDLGLYQTYANECSEAIQNGVTIYDIHSGTIEYPPLAIAWMFVPTLINDQDAEIASFNGNNSAWHNSFRFLYLFFDVIIFMVLCFMLLKTRPLIRVDIWSLTLYSITGLLLFNFLYDRQDLFLGGIMFLAFLLLISRIHWTISLLILAMGINFKLIPLLIAPVFIIGTLPVNSLKFKKFLFFQKEVISKVIFRSLYLISVIILVFLPFYILGGSSTLDFLTYHKERGLQLESVFSSVLVMLNYVGYPVSVTHGFGAYNLESSLSPFFVNISSVLVLIGVFFVLFLLYNQLKKCLDFKVLDNGREENSGTIASNYPTLFLYMILGILFISIITSKVFSPQYLLWIIPLFSLLPINEIRIPAFLFALTCLFTIPIFPYLYFSHFVHNPYFENGSIYWEPPTLIAGNLLLIRNFLLIATTITLLHSTTKTDYKKV